MDKKTTGIVAYITFIGWLIAFLAGDKEGAKFHLNQSLLLVLGNVVVWGLGFIPVIKNFTWILSLILFAFWIIGIYHAIKEEEKELPLIGGIKILK